MLYEGKVLDGWHRYQACLKAGAEPRTEPYTGSDPAAYVCSVNLHRRQESMTPAQKRELIGRVLKENPELSNIQVGKLTKADRETVAAQRTKLEDAAEIRNVATRTDTKGRKQRPRKKTKPKAKDELDEFTHNDPVRLNPIDRVYQVLDAWDEELVFELRVPARRTEFIRRMTNLVERGRELQEQSPDVQDKPLVGDQGKPPSAVIPVQKIAADAPSIMPEDDADEDSEMRWRRQRAADLSRWHRG